MLPLHHTSAVEVLEPLSGVAGLPLDGEIPLFAATRAFAYAEGGPITRAFIEALPDDWADAVVDSSLVWLTPGLAHDDEHLRDEGRRPLREPPRYRHEIFPGVHRGVRGEANRNLAARHRMCVLGLDCAPVAAVGEVRFESAGEAEAFWLPEALTPRDAQIRGWLEAGALTAHPLPVGAMLGYGWGALMCPRPAAAAGFQLVLRATAHDPRPRVNGRRNLTLM